jgi:membrane-bound lytic murein transglycosylase D
MMLSLPVAAATTGAATAASSAKGIPSTLGGTLPSADSIASALKPQAPQKAIPAPAPSAKRNVVSTFTPVDASPYFDIPITYNTKVKWWINYFQTGGRRWFKLWLERSNAYLPIMQKMLAARGMPQDLAYVAMIESGFSSQATSTAEAVGYWQFIAPTANRYGLKTTWWLDERRDFTKSTTAAASYLGDLFKQFGSWYLTAAAYNMGEGRTQRLVRKYNTKNYWILSKRGDFPEETKHYIPKLLAAMLIAKAPKLYGFHDLRLKEPYRYDYFNVPGGTDLMNLAKFTGIESNQMLQLNPELLKGFVPTSIRSHRIRIPKGTTNKVSDFVRAQM